MKNVIVFGATSGIGKSIAKILLNEGLKKVLKEINYWKKSPLWTAKKINNATKKN